MADDKDEKIQVAASCEGPDSVYVKLISSDGQEFVIKREHALVSGTIKAMLSGPGQYAEDETNQVTFSQISGSVLKIVCDYFAYKVKHTGSNEDLPPFDIPEEINLEVLMAANFLDC
uniref:Elongin-C n=1 Tax=Strigamia maritima TaxID=126957 RepID=T1J396_STRMM